MHDRHTNRLRYFNEQAYTIEKHVIPFIDPIKTIDSKLSVLEIGCGEGGNLKPFLDMGCERVVGIDLSEHKVELGREYFKDIPNGDRVELIVDDIYNIGTLGQFDLIITRDVLEHIHDQQRFMDFVKKFFKPGGKFFLGFPPWYNPFGGHQQMCKSKILSKLPYFHILPTPIYKGMLKLFGESEIKIEHMLEIKETGISIERFERILQDTNYHTDKRVYYMFNPNYEIKFNLKPRVQTPLLTSIPFVRNLVTTAMYYIVSPKDI